MATKKKPTPKRNQRVIASETECCDDVCPSPYRESKRSYTPSQIEKLIQDRLPSPTPFDEMVEAQAEFERAFRQTKQAQEELERCLSYQAKAERELLSKAELVRQRAVSVSR